MRLRRIWNQIPNPSINGRPTHFATWAASDYVILSYVECICTVETLMPFLKNENVLSALSECRNMFATFISSPAECLFATDCERASDGERRVISVGDSWRVSPVGETDTSGSVVFICGESDTQWVAPLLALISISFGLNLNTYATLHSGLLLRLTATSAVSVHLKPRFA